MNSLHDAWFCVWVGGDRFRVMPAGDAMELNQKALDAGKKEESVVVLEVAGSMEAALLRNLEFKRARRSQGERTEGTEGTEGTGGMESEIRG